MGLPSVLDELNRSLDRAAAIECLTDEVERLRAANEAMASEMTRLATERDAATARMERFEKGKELPAALELISRVERMLNDNGGRWSKDGVPGLFELRTAMALLSGKTLEQVLR